jgi:gliding motility-associated-like protein
MLPAPVLLRRPAWLLAGLLAAWPCSLASQNLVGNPSFENRFQCPFSGGQIRRTQRWYSPNRQSTDFFHRCGAPSMQVPTNQRGQQEPFEGDAYGGIYTFIDELPIGDEDYREYLSVGLDDSLEAGQWYRVSCMVSVGEVSGILSDDLGFYLGRDSLLSTGGILSLAPQVRQPPGVLISNYGGWQEVAGLLRAQGGERFLTIGNFLPDSLTTRRSSPAGSEQSVFYYIDEVVLRKCRTPFPQPLISASDSVLCPGDTIRLAVEGPGPYDIRWSDSLRLPARSVTQPGTYAVRVEADGCVLFDTLRIEMPLGSNLAPAGSSVLCAGELREAAVIDTSLRWQWLDGSAEPVRQLGSPGDYVLLSELGNCQRADTLRLVAPPSYPPAPQLDTALCEGLSLLLDPGIGGLAYRWDDGSSLPQREAQAPGTYTALLSGICYEDTARYRLEALACPCEWFAPDVFTPNGDAVNEAFRIRPGSGVLEARLEVFDRWGRRLRSAEEPGLEWEGRRQEAGLYLWALSYRCVLAPETWQRAAGSFSLLR